ncbi:MAG: type II secretion system F family protein, partial [bacterium]
MQSFNYQARNTSTGDKVKGIVQADSEQAATKLIRKQGLTPLSISVQKERGMFGGNKVKTKDKVLFSRQLSTLINAGLP